jgi:hypothetical protein
VYIRNVLCMWGEGMGCVCVVKVWFVSVWLRYGLRIRGLGMGFVVMVKVWVVYV